MTKLESLIQEVIQDERNQHLSHQQPIIQVHEQAKLLIVGQAPGSHAQTNLRPFADASGKTLLAWLGIDESIFYSTKVAILPMDFYYPGKAKTGDNPPRSFIYQDYHERFLALMPHIECTILLGWYAIKAYLRKEKYRNLTETVAHFDEYLPSKFPLVHPSPLNFRWQAKNPWFKEEVIVQLQKRVHDILKKEGLS